MTPARKTLVETGSADVVPQNPSWNLRFGSANVGSLVGRGAEVVEMMERRKVDLAGLQEVGYKGNGTRTLRGEKEDFKVFWCGEVRGGGGVGIVIKKSLCDTVVQVRRVNPRIIGVDFVVGRKVIQVFSVYAPQQGRSMEEKIEFYDQLTDEVRGKEGCVVLGDFNGHVGEEARGYEGVHGGCGFGERNREGEMLLDFADSTEMRIMNTYFRKELEKKVTYDSGGNKTRIDYMLVSKRMGMKVKDVKAVPGEVAMLQHRLVVMDVSFREGEIRRAKVARLRTWKLRQRQVREKIGEEVRHRLEGELDSWETANEIMSIEIKKACGVARGQHRQSKWWWQDVDVKRVTGEKNRRFRQWRKTRTEEDRVRYQAAKKEVKRKIAEVIDRTAKAQVKKLETMMPSERMREVFRMAKARARDKKDVDSVRCIENKAGELKVDLEDRLEVWKKYAEELLNQEHTRGEELEADVIEGPVDIVSVEEVREAIQRMKIGRAAGPSGVPVEVIKECGLETTIARIATDMLNGGSMPDSWRKSMLVPVYRGRGTQRSVVIIGA